jgi:hypothetical protein
MSVNKFQFIAILPATPMFGIQVMIGRLVLLTLLSPTNGATAKAKSRRKLTFSV